MSMRYVFAALGVLLVIGTLVAIKGCQIAKLISAGKQMEKAGPPPETVASAQTRELEWEQSLNAVGTINALHGVTIANEAPGRAIRVLFEDGAMAKRGQVLVELEAYGERAQLRAAKARRDLARDTADRSRRLYRASAIAQAQLDADESSLRAAEAEVGALEGLIARRIIRAPFDGRLGIRLVKPGEYLAIGAPVTTIDAAEAIHVDFTLPQQELGAIHVGMPVRATLEDGKAVAAVISAIDPSVDIATRAVRVRADIKEETDRLRPGMFVDVSVVLPERPKVVVVPVTAVVHATFGDSVFIIDQKNGDNVARQQFVRVGDTRGDFVRVLEGLGPGQEVVSGGAFKLRNGARIQINNDVKLEPQLNPQLENR
jgi:membrane fusion protein (multidrug efflux system)